MARKRSLPFPIDRDTLGALDYVSSEDVEEYERLSRYLERRRLTMETERRILQLCLAEVVVKYASLVWPETQAEALDAQRETDFLLEDSSLELMLLVRGWWDVYDGLH